MIAVFAFAMGQAGSAPASTATVASAFIAECTRAVNSIKEGRVTFKMEIDGHTLGYTLVVKGDQNLSRSSVDGKPFGDVLWTPTRVLYVLRTSRQYQENTYATRTPHAEPLPPLQPGSYECKLDAMHGFVLRTNPDFSKASVTRSGSQETLLATLESDAGKERLRIVLSRDVKTQRPTNVTIKVGESEGKIRIACEERRIKDADLVVDPASYAGFTKIDWIK